MKKNYSGVDDLWQPRGRQMSCCPTSPSWRTIADRVLEDTARQEQIKAQGKRAFRAAPEQNLKTCEKAEDNGEEFVEPTEEGQEPLPENDDDLASTDEEVGEIEEGEVSQTKEKVLRQI